MKEELHKFAFHSPPHDNEEKSFALKVDFYQTLDIIIPDRNLISVASDMKTRWDKNRLEFLFSLSSTLNCLAGKRDLLNEKKNFFFCWLVLFQHRESAHFATDLLRNFSENPFWNIVQTNWIFDGYLTSLELSFACDLQSIPINNNWQRQNSYTKQEKVTKIVRFNFLCFRKSIYCVNIYISLLNFTQIQKKIFSAEKLSSNNDK